MEVKQIGGPRKTMFPLRTVVIGTFAPALLFGVAIGVVLPLIPLSATRLGGSLAVAGFVAALMPLGRVLADVPAGLFAARVGDRMAMLAAALLGAASACALAWAPALWVLGAGTLTMGGANAVFNLARQSYLTEITPPGHRARVLSALGGMHRIGYFIGPFLGAAVLVGSTMRPAYWLAAGFASVSALVIVAVRAETHPARDEELAPQRARVSLLSMLQRHRHLIMTLGATTFLVGAVRGARTTVLPLWGEHLGLDADLISVIFGISGGLDMVFFYPAGKVMDRLGRLWIAVPSMLLLALSMLLLPAATTASTTAFVAVLLGIGNGVGSGLMMTLGADVAPADERSAFLGVWRLFQDSGDAAGPLIIAGGAAAGSLAAGIWVTGTMGLGAVAGLGRWVPRYSAHANRTTRRRAGIPSDNLAG